MRDGREEKKLIEAARRLCGARPPTDQDDVALDLARFGAPSEEIERWTAAIEEQPFAILPECAPAIELFLLSGTQWRTAGMSGVATGMDYAGVRAAAAMAGVEPTPEVFADLRVMEGAALRYFGERCSDD